MSLTSNSKRNLSGYLSKFESRSLGGVVKRKYWFVLSRDSPYLFWYKSPSDVNPLGKLPLTGAGFTFDPTAQPGEFQIHCGNEVFVLDADNSECRSKWLEELQLVRRQQFVDQSTSNENDQNASEEKTEVAVGTLIDINVDDTQTEENKEIPCDPVPDSDIMETQVYDCNSTFYVTETGSLHCDSLRMPINPPAPLPTDKIEAVAADVWDQIKIRTQPMNFDEEKVDAGRVTRSSSSSQSQRHSSKSTSMSQWLPSFGIKKPCESCKEFLSVIQNLRERVCDLKDENNANKDLVDVLRVNLLARNNQVAALREIQEKQDFGDRIQFILDRESKLATLELECAEQKRKIEELAQSLKSFRGLYDQAFIDLQAYKDSMRTKEELILKLVSQTEQPSANDEKNRTQSDTLGLDVGVDVGNISKDGLKNARELETQVSDLPGEIDRLQITVKGYEKQNQFLNQEVLDLQTVVENSEKSKQVLIGANLDLTAQVYRLRSKYMMLLNHVKAAGIHGLEANVIEKLIYELKSEPSSTANVVSPPDDMSEDLSPNETICGSEPVTDQLGFYLADAKTRAESGDGDLLATAAQWNKKADEIVLQKKQEESNEYVRWLDRWDSFLVTFTQTALTPSQELKLLVRTGVPHTYRTRVWKSLIYHWVVDTYNELGKTYYQSLLKKQRSVPENSYDPSIKQIDLDIARTLPGNKYFETEENGKLEQLRNVLYAYRWHNKEVGYCQGLNRIAAVALLYLDEPDAFWFMSAFIEHLQPKEYYTQTLLCALVDQKVLKDLVADKLPKISNQLKAFEVDLSLFTLSWFLTCFVDTLPHKVYLKIFDVFLYEGNKVLFRFALAVLKLSETQILACRTAGSLHSCVSRVAQQANNYQRLAQIAFDELNPFPLKTIENRRQHYLNQLRTELSPRLKS